jgi:hypothetical protein
MNWGGTWYWGVGIGLKGIGFIFMSPTEMSYKLRRETPQNQYQIQIANTT